MSDTILEARSLLAKAAEHETRHEGAAAIAPYERALALGLSPDERYRALLGLGSALRSVGRHHEAVQVFRVTIAEFPEMAAPHAHLALALHANGKDRQALLTLMDLVLRHVPLAEQEAALVEQRDLLARDPGPDERWRALAQSLTRKEFVQAYPFPFLYEVSGRMRAALVTDAVDDEDTKVGRRGKDAGSGSRAATTAAARPPAEEAFILPLRKVATTVPSAITFGRGNNNDVVLPDAFVSKVHAFLRRSERGWELADAGARNGAWIGGRRLDSKGAPAPVRSGDLLTFGRVVFFFLDAGDLWDRLHPRGGKP